LRIRVLGASGGELPGRSTTCFLVDGRLALDAGALTSSLSLAELERIDHVLLTHAHLDHVKDVPLLADLMAGRRRKPFTVHASPEAVRTLRRHLFNGKLWPDFTRIPSPSHPVVRLQAFRPGKPFRVGRYSIAPTKVRHVVESTGFVVSRAASAFAVSGDTGPTRAFWASLSAAPPLGALFVETSFPSAMQWLADLSGHLTPKTLVRELSKVERAGIPVYLYHLKPAWEADLKRDIASLRIRGVKVLRKGDVIVV